MYRFYKWQKSRFADRVRFGFILGTTEREFTGDALIITKQRVAISRVSSVPARENSLTTIH